MTVKNGSKYNFFGGKQEWNNESESIVVPEVLCRDWLRTGYCGDVKFICQESNCLAESLPNPDYIWPLTTEGEAVICEYTKRTIMAQNKDSFVYGSCKAKDLNCTLKNSIIILA